MSREDFISDNLVDMREKLRRNYAAMNAQMQKSRSVTDPGNAPAPAPVSAPDAGATDAPSAAPEPETAPLSAPKMQALPPPLPRSAAPDDLERSKRELEGALHRDHARIRKELELLQTKKEEQEAFFTALMEFLKELEQTTDRRQLDLLRLRYLEAQGRAQAYLGDASGAPRSAQEEPRTMGRIFAEGMPYLVGAILSALIIAATIAFLF